MRYWGYNIYNPTFGGYNLIYNLGEQLIIHSPTLGVAFFVSGMLQRQDGIPRKSQDDQIDRF